MRVASFDCHRRWSVRTVGGGRGRGERGGDLERGVLRTAYRLGLFLGRVDSDIEWRTIMSPC
jgi:hypothetical protein